MATEDDLARSTMPLCETLGIRTVATDPDRVVLTMDWSPERCTVGEALHGGALMALADSAGAICAFLNLPDGAVGTSTIQSASNFIGAVRSGEVVATSTPLHTGRSTIVVQTQVHHEGRLVAVTTQTQTVLRP